LEIEEKNMDEFVQDSGIKNKYTSTGRQSGYKIDLYHSGLDEHKHLSATEHSALLGKIHNQKLLWQEKYLKEVNFRQLRNSESAATERTRKAQEKIAKIEGILAHTLKINDAIDWSSLMQNDAYIGIPRASQFIKFNAYNGYPEKVSYLDVKTMPQPERFFIKVGFLDKILGKEKSIREKQQKDFDNSTLLISQENEEVRRENLERDGKLKEEQSFWEKERSEHERKIKTHNDKVEKAKEKYFQKNIDAIIEYCEMVLNNSHYPESFPRDFDIQYNENNGMLLLEYRLPALRDIPRVSNVRYVKSRNEIEEKFLSQSDHTKLYDLAIYQTVLRTLHELFEADVANVINCITLNGFVTDINPSTGHVESNCIVSIQTSKQEFDKVNLKGIVSSISYKECFKSLKGVGSSKLSTMTAIKPILELNRSDKRFKNHYDVAHNLNDSINIAAMPWEDFEHLVREIFAKEFTSNGGEVKVTRASVDGGVDAVAFDPDPIRGGKIVIQAKRYTNVVGVSAVRDLYGTVMNEGATKGILVTTADYGSDSYEFAKGKPLTLLNGSNLLHLLEKHGQKAKIDLKEAKKILKDQAA
jgi:restriction system protein